MRYQKTIWLKILVITICFLPLLGHAQFYNGHQMSFGKNRVQYNDFYWQYYRFDKFDTYFYVGGSKIGEYVSKVATQQLERLEYSLDEILQRRIIFIVYNKQSEFRQSNIGLVSGQDDYNIGGVVRIVDNKVFLYYEGDHDKLQKQIQASIIEILINEMLYGGSFRSRFKSSLMLNLPEWYTPGLISYFAYDLDFDTEAKVKTTMLDKQSRKINQLHGNDAKYAGHSLWRYIGETYGRETVSNIVYMTRITKSAESGFLYVLGMPLKDIINDWFYYYQGRYQQEIDARDIIPDNSQTLKKRIRKQRVYDQVKISPDKKYIAYTSNEEGKYIVWLYNIETNKTKRILSREHKVEQIADYSYPILAWHPTGSVLTYIYERKGEIWVEFYTIETKERQRRQIFYLDKVLDYAFSHDGQQFVISAVDNGFTDLYVYSMSGSTYTRLTNDIADDLYPRFIENSTKIIFSSNRKNTKVNYQNGEESEFQEYFDLFIYDFANKADDFTRLSTSYQTNEIQPVVLGKDKYAFLSDHNGLQNKFVVSYDSAINFIDTAIHYRNFVNTYPISDRAFSINSFDYLPTGNLSSELFKGEKKYKILKEEPVKFDLIESKPIEDTWFRRYFYERKALDSLITEEMNRGYEADSVYINEFVDFKEDSLIDINYYIFDIEKQQQIDLVEDNPLGKKGTLFKLPKQMVYFTNFYTNLMVTQVDFGFMNQSYQAYTGSAYYYNPGINLFTKIGAIDLFEDYKITAGIRWSFDLNIDELLVSVENVKNRLDKQVIYHRQVFEAPNSEYYTKVHSNNLMGVFKYPLTQIYGFRGTVSARTDNFIYKALDLASLQEKDELQVWGGLKGEFIFDNTRKPGINLYDGTRFKIFGEYYARINKEENAHMFVVGFDARNYIPIHRGMILATRWAGSSSFGNAPLIYYLGGVDNWMNFSRDTPTFDYSTQINQDKNWAYQSVATNMRGFVQNARNGNSFSVANIELRWPVIHYMFNRPISNDFLNNFMVVGFVDAGSAWEGWNPLNADNAYDYEPIYNGPVTVIIDRKHSPIIGGIGFGFRSRLLGYYIRTDWAWGIDGGRVMPRVFYLSLSTDF